MSLLPGLPQPRRSVLTHLGAERPIASRCLRLRAEDLPQLERRRRLQLVIAAVLRPLVGPPADERGAVPEAVALQVVIGDLHDALRAERLPREITPPVPATRRAGNALPARLVLGGPLGPLAPGVSLHCVLAQRLQ